MAKIESFTKPDEKTIGQLIKNWRKMIYPSATQAAKAYGVSTVYWCDVENGVRLPTTYLTANKISKFLKLNVFTEAMFIDKIHTLELAKFSDRFYEGVK